MLNPIFSGYYNYDAKEENGKITFTLTPATPPEEQKAPPKKKKQQKQPDQNQPGSHTNDTKT
jgi:hypothetical protein